MYCPVGWSVTGGVITATASTTIAKAKNPVVMAVFSSEPKLKHLDIHKKLLSGVLKPLYEPCSCRLDNKRIRQVNEAEQAHHH